MKPNTMIGPCLVPSSTLSTGAGTARRVSPALRPMSMEAAADMMSAIRSGALSGTADGALMPIFLTHIQF
ncbi:hypothetical protein GCM10009702_03470 [Propioniferax innocua]